MQCVSQNIMEIVNKSYKLFRRYRRIKMRQSVFVMKLYFQSYNNVIENYYLLKKYINYVQFKWIISFFNHFQTNSN